MDLTAVFQLDFQYELARYFLLQAHVGRGDTDIAVRELKGLVTPEALPDGARVLRTVHFLAATELVAEVDDMTVMMRCTKTGGEAWASGSDAARLRALLTEIAGRCPRGAEPRRVEVTFTDQYSTRSNGIDVRPWSEISGHYAADVSASLAELVEHRPSPDESRRLLLWHGAPGTGKTSAIRSLLLAWREWADGVVVTDPESLLSDGRYLRRTVFDHADEDRWLVLVMEDAEALLHKGSGKGMAKLLNLGDGLLGQGLRCLFLITTNEPLHAVHPALIRPGRCLSRLEFAALPASQAAGLLGRPVDRDMTLAEVMAAKPLTVVQEPVAVGQYL